MKRMVELGWAPGSIDTLQRLVKVHERGGLVLNTPWGGPAGGRPRLLNKENVNSLVEKMHRDEAHGEDSVKKP